MKGRLRRTGATAPGRVWRRWFPYATGALVALVAVLVLWSALRPGQPPLTQRDVDDTVAKALASVTPPPAFSAAGLPASSRRSS